MESAVVQKIGGRGVPLLFAHANGYPPGSYQALFSHLKSGFSISAVEHRALWAGRHPPKRLNWGLFASDMLDTIDACYSEPVWVMGHSMGGTTAALAALRQPEKIAGLILLDPVFLPDRFVLLTKLMSAKKREKIPMIRRALSRPEHFESTAVAFDFYRSKRAFKGLSDDALSHYVEASNSAMADGSVQLRYSGAWEAAVYASAPRAKPLMKGIRMPTLALRGAQSDTLRAEVWARWQRWQPQSEFEEISGGHLFPMEAPEVTADAALRYIRGR